MKLAAHTMATPAHTLAAALELYAHLGFDAVEIIWQDGYLCGLSEHPDASEIRSLQRTASDLGLEIAALTPYYTDLNAVDRVAQAKAIDDFRRCIDVAAELDCRRIRAYAGRFIPGDDAREVKHGRLIDGLRIVGDYADRMGVAICVENHFNTMAVSARETADLVASVASGGVGILYDQANLTFTHQEAYTEAIALQAPWVRHVHVKDLVFTEPDAEFVASDVARVGQDDRNVRSRPVGLGVIEWPDILRHLARTGYRGFLSFEYEYRWHPGDLPEPQDGLQTSLQHVRRLLDALEQPSGAAEPAWNRPA